MRFDFTSLHIFVCVAEEKSLTRASKRVHLAVSAISKRVAELEQQAGSPLFRRFARGMELTPSGQSMLSYARQVFETLQRMEDELSDFSGGIRGDVRLHATTSALAQFLPLHIDTFAVQYPGIRLDLEERVGRAVVDAVVEGRADVGVFSGITPARDLEIFDYRTDKLAVALAPDHPLAQREMLRFSEVIRHEIIASHTDSALYSLITREAEKLAIRPRIRIRVSSFDCICQLVAARQGVAILPAHVIQIYSHALSLVCVRLDEPWSKRQLLVGVRDFHAASATVRAFIEHLRLPDEHLKPEA